MLALRFQWLQQICVILKAVKTRFCKIQARHRKFFKTKLVISAEEDTFLGHYFESPFLVWCVELRVGNQKINIFHAILHISPLPWKLPASPTATQKAELDRQNRKSVFQSLIFRRLAKRRRRIFCAPAAITGARLHSTKHCQIGAFWHPTLRAPFLNASPGASSND